MSKQTPEERAKEYAQSVVSDGIKVIDEEIYASNINYAMQCHLAGYDQAVKDQSSLLSQYREALRDIVDGIQRIERSLPETTLNDVKVNIYSLSEDLALYKQLLKEKI